MLTLPDAIISILKPFAPMFQAKTWTKAHVLLVGTVLATRKRTVTSALRIMGLSDDTSFARYHHVLNRAVWSPTAVTLPSTRSPSVSPCPAPSPSSPDCAWMPRSMNPLHLDCQDRSVVRASKANGCPPSRNSPTNRQPSGQA